MIVRFQTLLSLTLIFFGCGGGSGHNPPVARPTAVGYTANINDNTVTSFLLDESTGGLTLVATAPTGALPTHPVVTPDHRLLFVSNFQDGTISRFLLDGNGGMKSAGNAIHLLTTGASPGKITISPSGQFLYVGAGSSNQVEVFQINAETGDLQPIQESPFAANSGGGVLVLSHSGRLLFAAGNDAIDVFAVDTTGALSLLETTHADSQTER
ncbi:MAG TPA: beta-propeller fold lactonase family protein [Terriglobales bacterium]|nr:beta-propeller fold lactonase family protein [Terriglobales bacterium]